MYSRGLALLAVLLLPLGLRSHLYGCIFTSNFFPPQQCSFLFFYIHLIFDFSHLISCSWFTYYSLFTCDQHFFLSNAKSSLGDCSEHAIVTQKEHPFHSFRSSLHSTVKITPSASCGKLSANKKGKSFDLTQSSVPLGSKIG